MKCKKRQVDIQKAFAQFMDDYQTGGISVGQIYRKGAQWADKNPCLDEIFHPATEKPIEGRSILQFSMGAWDVDNYNPKYDGSWFNYVREYKVKGWIYTDDITNTITKLKDDNSGD